MRPGPTFRSLAERNYRLFFLGALVSNVGTWMAVSYTHLDVYKRQVSNSFRRGHYPDRKEAEKVAAVLRAVASHLDGA